MAVKNTIQPPDRTTKKSKK